MMDGTNAEAPHLDLTKKLESDPRPLLLTQDKARCKPGSRSVCARESLHNNDVQLFASACLSFQCSVSLQRFSAIREGHLPAW